jgi:hypothetical protein
VCEKLEEAKKVNLKKKYFYYYTIMAALDGEALFMWLYERRGQTLENKEDEISFNQFGDFNSDLAQGLAREWFPNSITKQGQLQSVWTNHPKRQQGNHIHSFTGNFHILISVFVYSSSFLFCVLSTVSAVPVVPRCFHCLYILCVVDKCMIDPYYSS